MNAPGTFARLQRVLQRYWIVVPLLLLALWLRDWAERPPAGASVEPTIDMRSTRTDYYLEDFHTRHFDDTGTLEYEIFGRSLSHFPTELRAEVLGPRVVFRRDDIVWDIRSDRGTLLDPPREQLTLDGKVVIERASGDAEPITLMTSELLVQPQSNRISTEAPVTVQGRRWQLSATGLQSTLDTGKLLLPANVTARYELPDD